MYYAFMFILGLIAGAAIQYFWGPKKIEEVPVEVEKIIYLEKEEALPETGEKTVDSEKPVTKTPKKRSKKSTKVEG